MGGVYRISTAPSSTSDVCLKKKKKKKELGINQIREFAKS